MRNLHFCFLKKYLFIMGPINILSSLLLAGAEFQDGQGFRTIAQLPMVQVVLYFTR